jgi:hypothetical protein
MAARSVDSECKSRVIEPRNIYRRGSLRGHTSGGNTGPLYWLGGSGPAGVEEQGRCIVGFPRKLGDPVFSTLKFAGMGSPADQVPGLWMGPSGIHGSEIPERRGVVPLSEGDGACGKEAGSLSPFIVPIESRETYPGEACE